MASTVYLSIPSFNSIFQFHETDSLDHPLLGCTPNTLEQLGLKFTAYISVLRFPRRVSLEELSRELGIAKSTLNEILRGAERKIVTAYMRHDLPHLILRRVLEETQRLKLKMQSST